MRNEKGHLKHTHTHTHTRSTCAHTCTGALSHTNDDHYSLELKGRGELDSVIPFTKICLPHVVIPEHLKTHIRTVNRNVDNSFAGGTTSLRHLNETTSAETLFR